MDVMSELLQTVRLSASSYFCTDFSAPWGMHEAQHKQGVFHAVLRGQAWLHCDELAEPLAIAAGDIVAFPSGQAHRLGDLPESPTLPGANVVSSVLAGENPFAGSGQQTTLLCGYFDYDQAVSHPMLAELPTIIHITTGEQPELAWLWQLVNSVAREWRSQEPGASIIVNRLTEVLVIQLLRVALTEQQHERRFLSALGDIQIGAALQMMHEKPSYNWTLLRLAEEVGLSRTGFNNRFRDKVGVPALTYLTGWRMELARQKLIEGTPSTLAIAEAVGYGSEAAFNKAFSKHFGIGPGKMRRQLASP